MCTALSRRPHVDGGVLKRQCSDFPPFRSFDQGPIEFRKVDFVPSK